MFSSLKKFLKWGPKGLNVNQDQQRLLIISMLKGILEDVLFWKSKWLSLSFILFMNLLFLIFISKQINLFQLLLLFYLLFVIIDVLETWLKHKHRHTCLKRLAEHDSTKLNSVIAQVNTCVYRKWIEISYLRQTNHTKAFLLINVTLVVVFAVGKWFSGYLLSYLLCMCLCTFYKIAPPVIRFIRKIQQNADSDVEFEGLVPDVSDVDINLLSIEPEPNQAFDERQSLDYWKPNDVPTDESSDSSDHSSSLVKNLSIEKIKNFDKEVESSDSSEDEYTPIEHFKDKLQSTMEVLEATPTWSSSAYNAFWNITSSVSNMIYAKTEENKRKRIMSVDSSDGFEMVDKQDLL